MTAAQQEIGSLHQTETILDHYPKVDVETIVWNSGTCNVVGLVDTYEGLRCFRFPRTQKAQDLLAYECQVLEHINEHGPLSIATPAPLILAADHSYAVITGLAGRVVHGEELHQLAETQQIAAGRAIGNFMTELNDIIPATGMPGESRMRKSLLDDHAWYTRMYGLQDKAFGTLYSRFFEDYSQSRIDRQAQKEVVIHSDLHPDNLLFGDRNELSGVIDFSEIGFGDVHQELRSVYRTGGRIVLEAAIDALDERFSPIDANLIASQAALHELAIIIERAARKQLHDTRAALADAALSRWLGDMWGGLEVA
jgi:aminoglycoside phosphotransferase (APT) family kinase protein